MLNVLLLMKLALDFLSVQRGAAFLLCILVSLFIIVRTRVAVVDNLGGVRSVAAFLVVTLVAYLQSGSTDQAVKYLGLALLAVAIPIYLKHRSPENILVSATALLWANLSFSVLCILRSVLAGHYAEREFAPFEHANLFGSYILSAIPLLFVVESRTGFNWSYRLILILLAWASTSTGTGVLALLLLVNFNRISYALLLRTLLLAVVSVWVAEAVLRIVNPELHVKIFSPFAFLVDFGWDTLFAAARSGYSLYDFGPEYGSSLTWRIYAYVVFLSHVATAPLAEVIFGSGFSGYAGIWNGYMPHNDFILTLVDFGLVGVGVLLYFLLRSTRFVLHHRELLGLVPIIVFRLMFENNIYSFYLMSSLVINSSFLIMCYRSAGGVREIREVREIR
jgi:hypothetical protein